jgi:AcrR family transcriptional regulator
LPLGKVCQNRAVESSLRERKKQRTRAALADVALELFAARGFAAVTMAEIAAAAEVGPRTVYRYVTDKQELLFGADDEVLDHLREALAARPAAEPPARAVVEAVRALVPLWGDRQAEGRARAAVIAASPELLARQRGKQAAEERVLADGLVARGLAAPQAGLLARAAVVCADEAVTRWLDDADPRAPGLDRRLRGTVAELAGLLGAAQPG